MPLGLGAASMGVSTSLDTNGNWGCLKTTPMLRLALLILHCHRNPPTIIPIVERRDLQPAAEAELQPAIGT